MSFLQVLSAEDASHALADAAARGTPLTAVVYHQNRWVVLRSRVLAFSPEGLWMSLPEMDHLTTPYDFPIGGAIGGSFIQMHHKVLFLSQVESVDTYSVEGVPTIAVQLAPPRNMRRLEHRLAERMEAMPGENARVSLWLGGHDACPEELSVDHPIWTGTVLNISSGGFLARVSPEAGKYIDVGDIAGACIQFESQGQATLADAQLRHCQRDGESVLMGFQFISQLDPDAALLRPINAASASL